MTANNRCDIHLEPGRTIKLAPEPNAELLNERELADYREHRYQFIQWLLNEGKTPQKHEGYSEYTCYETGYRTARFDKWVWDREEQYLWPPTPEAATAYVTGSVSERDIANATRGKIEEALQRYFRFVATTGGGDAWEHDQIWTSSGDDAPRDYLSRDERRQVYQTVLSGDDYGWRETSLVATSLDAALRPVEVKRASTDWIDLANNALRIPREDSSKNKNNWTAALSTRTVTALRHWTDARAEKPMYDGTDAIWLTREATRYSSRSLARLLRRIFDDAGIPPAGRDVTWYMLRHHVGTYLTQEMDLAAAAEQLRHTSITTTAKYDQSPIEDRKTAIEDL